MRVQSLLTAGLLLTGSAGAAPQQFDLVDVTDQMGVQFSYGSGGRLGFAIGDFDGDTWQDIGIFGAGADDSTILFRNQGALIRQGQAVPWFVNVTDQFMPANDIPTSLGAFADLDNDGDQDLVVMRRGVNPTTQTPIFNTGALAYFENRISDGLGFVTGTSPTRLGAQPATATSLALVDCDGDSDLDVFMSYSPANQNTSTSRCFMIRNDGLPNLVDVSDSFGAPISTVRRALTAVFADFDGDMRPDLHCAVDFFTDFQCKNMGGGLFQDVTVAANVTNVGSDMGLAVGDIDNDLDLDIYSTNINEGVLYVNDGTGVFQNEAAARGCRTFNGTTTTIGWGTNFVDLDNDGDLDLTMVPTGPGGGHVWMNNGLGFFSQVTAATGVDPRGYAIIDFDFDKDGDQDLLGMGNGTATRPRFWANTSSGANHWLVVELTGTKSNRDAIGAQVIVRTPDGKSQMRALMAGHSYRTGTPKTMHFGLGDQQVVSEIEIRWPNGQVDKRGPFVADRYVHAVE